jgi:hypothetical protein
MENIMNAWWKGKGYGGGSPDAVYGMGLIGAAVYYLQHATSFQDGLIGILKAIVWPGILVYKVFQLLGM